MTIQTPQKTPKISTHYFCPPQILTLHSPNRPHTYFPCEGNICISKNPSMKTLPGAVTGKLRKWSCNFRRTLSAAWIRWEPMASFSLFLTEERLLWKLTRRETGWHSSNIRCINENVGFWIARCGLRILCCRSRMAGTGFSIPCPWNVDSRFQSLARFRASYIELAPAVQKVDNAIHRINLYPVDSAISFAHTYPLDSEFIRWIALCILWTTGSEFRISNHRTDSGSV